MRRVRTSLAVIAVACLGFFAAGCATVASPAVGVLVMDVKGPVDAGDRVGQKEGRACAMSYFGLFATGDASIATAASNGGITNIGSVDHHSTHTLVVGQYCTVVRGS